MSKLKRYFFLIVMLFCCNSYAQNKTINKIQVEELVKKGNKYFKQADFSNSLKTLKSALYYARLIKNDSLAAEACNRIARNFDELNDTITSLEFYKKALFHAEKAKDLDMKTTIYINLGNFYSDNKVYRYKCIDYYNKALILSEKVKDTSSVLLVNMNIAWTYIENEQFDKGYPYLEYVNHNIKYIIKEDFIAVNMLNGMYYAAKGNYSKADSFFKKGLHLSDTIVLRENKDKLYLEYAKFLFKTGDYKNAYKNLEEYNKTVNVLYEKNKMKNASVSGLDLKVASYKNDLLALESSQKLQDSNLRLSKIINFSSLFVLVILGLLLYSFNRNIKLKQRSNANLIVVNESLNEAKNKAEEAVRLKSQFMSTVSHELRTPLYGVVGLTEIIEAEHQELKDSKYIKPLQFSAKYLLSLINDILNLSKLDEGKIELFFENVTLASEIQTIVDSLQVIANHNHNKIIVIIDDNTPQYAEIDKTRLSQVIINLISNSLKFTRQGSVTLKVGYEESANFLMFEVIDTGIGIPKKYIDSVFDKFIQVERDSDEQYQGTGLGLAIVKRIVDLFGGQIFIESTEFVGTSIKFTIPFKKGVAMTDGINSKLFSGKELHILVVEDNKINQMVTQKLLEKHHLKCDIASDGYEAIKRVSEHQFDLILMDIHMPGINGFETTEKIKDMGITTPIIALTASDKYELEDKVQQYKMSDILVKPFNFSELQSLLEKYI